MGNDTDHSKLKNLLSSGHGCPPPAETLDAFLNSGYYRHYNKWENICEVGKVCSDFMIVEEGIVRFSDMNGDKERTFAFCPPGSVVTSKYSFVMNQPSYYSIDACTPCSIWTISKQDFWNFMNEHPDMSLCMLRYAYGELFLHEYRNCEINNGSARDRYLGMIRTCQDIIDSVPQKIIASYLGITPEYLSKLKKEFARIPKEKT